jgi:DedD protein
MDIALKQRLVGASVLIALAVVVLPMLLGGRPDNSIAESQKIEVPPPPSETEFETRRYPIGETPTPDQAEPETAAPLNLPSPDSGQSRREEFTGESRPGVAETVELTDQGPAEVFDPQSEPVVTAPESTPEPEPEPEITPQPAAASKSPATSATGRYVVQVASFGSVDNAKRLSTKLQGLGYNVMSDRIESEVGTLSRVRVGPYASEAEAERAVAQLQEQVDGTKPRVMDLQPGRAERVTQPSDPLVRWVVQVGSFSTPANADSLVARLRLEGLSAYKEQVSSSGSVIYRVRVGPYLERDEAIRVDKQINDRHSIDGVVMSAD